MSYLIVPGWTGSGPDHWQTFWEQDLPSTRRVEMPDWDKPRRDDWVAALDAAVRASPSPPLLVAHSLGCITVAHWVAVGGRARGALLVAPADVERSGAPRVLRGFAPVPRVRLPFPTCVVTSDNDPHVSLTRASAMAADWGSSLVVLEGAGHINAESGLGRWREGHQLLARTS